MHVAAEKKKTNKQQHCIYDARITLLFWGGGGVPINSRNGDLLGSFVSFSSSLPALGDRDVTPSLSLLFPLSLLHRGGGGGGELEGRGGKRKDDRAEP